MRNRILHLEPGTVGFNSYTAAEYLEEMLGRFMNARTKGGTKEEFEQKKQGADEDTLEYYDTKLQLYLHAYDEGERNIQELKRLTLNGLRNIRMLQNCWNMLSKRTNDWAEIRMTIEDQLTVQRTWNLHPNNPNPDMTGLKDAYKSREESNLGKTEQIRMEINAVNKPEQNAPVFYHATNPTPNRTVTLATKCEDTLSHLGNCYDCNKPGHLKRDCPEKTSTQAQARLEQDKERKLYVSTVIKRDTSPGSAGDQRRTTDETILRIQRK